MLNELTRNVPVYIVTGYTDMRKSIDGLAIIIQAQLRLDPFSKALFLFCGRSCDRIKGLLWEGDGGMRRFSSLVQAIRQRSVPVASQRDGSSPAHTAADALAFGGFKD